MNFGISANSFTGKKINAKAISSTRSRVTNLKPYFPKNTDAGDFMNMIAENVAGQFDVELTEPPSCKEIEDLAARNASSDWLYPKSNYLSDYTVRKKKKYEFGLVNLNINMSNDVISEIKIYGDFFSTKDISELESLIKDTDIKSINEKIKSVNLGEYIFGISKTDFLHLIKE